MAGCPRIILRRSCRQRRPDTASHVDRYFSAGTKLRALLNLSTNETCRLTPLSRRQTADIATMSQPSDKAVGSKGTSKKDMNAAFDEKLDTAEASIVRSQEATAKLNHWWRTYLFRIAIVVLLITLYQFHIAMVACNDNFEVSPFVPLGTWSYLLTLLNRTCR